MVELARLREKMAALGTPITTYESDGRISLTKYMQLVGDSKVRSWLD